MPYLRDIHYSRNATVAAIRYYYKFITRMYLDEFEILEPPEGGWPHITPEATEDCGKSEEVISLLRHLPYINSPNRDNQGASYCEFAN